VVSADPEFNHFILQQEGRLVESWYLDLFAKVFKQRENRPDGAYIHKYVRNLALSHFGAETLKAKLLFQLEELVNRTLQAWSSQESIDVKRAAATVKTSYSDPLRCLNAKKVGKNYLPPLIFFALTKTDGSSFRSKADV
jgi:hypothetical protein